jgi:hypothetical protein
MLTNTVVGKKAGSREGVGALDGCLDLVAAQERLQEQRRLCGTPEHPSASCVENVCACADPGSCAQFCLLECSAYNDRSVHA